MQLLRADDELIKQARRTWESLLLGLSLMYRKLMRRAKKNRPPRDANCQGQKRS
jgi:hypothetical protein